MSRIKQIHQFGPPVGKYIKEGTVSQTFARERKRLKELADIEREQKVRPIKASK